MNTKSKNQVLAAGKYSKGQFEMKTLGEDGKVKIVKFTKSTSSTVEVNENTKNAKENLTTYNMRKPKLPAQESIDVPDFMKKRSAKMQKERLRKDMGFLGTMIYNLNLSNEW